MISSPSWKVRKLRCWPGAKNGNLEGHLFQQCLFRPMLHTSITTNERGTSHQILRTLYPINVRTVFTMNIFKSDTIVEHLFFLIGIMAKTVPLKSILARCHRYDPSRSLHWLLLCELKVQISSLTTLGPLWMMFLWNACLPKQGLLWASSGQFKEILYSQHQRRLNLKHCSVLRTKSWWFDEILAAVP